VDFLLPASSASSTSSRIRSKHSYCVHQLWIYCQRCSSFRPHARELPTVEPVTSTTFSSRRDWSSRTAQSLGPGEVAVHVVRRGESYCTVLMPFSLLNLPHTNTTLNRAEHALAADTPRTQLEVRRHMDPRSSASRISNNLLYGSLVRWSQNKRKAERLLNKRRGNLGGTVMERNGKGINRGSTSTAFWMVFYHIYGIFISAPDSGHKK
jgi:hypothetical protein